jgi:hypothetical protein
MQSGIIAIVVVGVSCVLCFNACKGDDCELTATCSGPSDTTLDPNDGGASAADAGRVYPPVPPPPGCAPLADPIDTPACIDERYALFVDGDSGDDLNPGTMTKPLRSIAAATDVDTLAGRARIYVTSAEQRGSIVLPPNVSLVGGVDRATWRSTIGSVTKLTSEAAGALLRIAGSSEGVQLVDVDVTPAAGSQPGESSIGLEIISSTVTLRRVAIHAQSGTRGVVAPTKDNRRQSTGEGQPGVPGRGADGPTCTCGVQGSTTGGRGGDPNQRGADGASDPPGSGSGTKTSLGGAAGPTCGNGAPGYDGAPGAGGAGSAVVGHMTPNGWQPANGADGAYGGNGGGGGGGGGGPTTGGASGGCGGCGGAGGAGGGAGGSSIGVAAFESDLTLSDTTIETQAAGSGERGGGGQAGQPGAPGNSTGACTGGAGGIGAGGSGGGGGAGGVSVPIVRFRGNVTKLGTVTLTAHGAHGQAGGGGARGEPASSSSGQPGNLGFGGTALTAPIDDLELTQ